MLAGKKEQAELKQLNELKMWAAGPLGETLARIEAVIKDSPRVAVRSLDRKGVICHWNNACEHIYGYTSTQALGKRFQDIRLSKAAA